MCPIYMAYGMSYYDFWHCSPDMYVAYRKAHELDIKRRNEEMWLQGLYIFEAVSVAISNVHLDGKSHKINKYREKPFDLFEKTDEEKKQQAIQDKQKVIDSLNRFMAHFGKREANGN